MDMLTLRNIRMLIGLSLTVFLLAFTLAGCDAETIVMRDREAATVRTAITVHGLVKNGAGVWSKAKRKLVVGETVIGLSRPKFEAAVSSGSAAVKGAPIIVSDRDIFIIGEAVKIDVWLIAKDGTKVPGVRDVQPGELALGDVKLAAGTALPVVPITVSTTTAGVGNRESGVVPIPGPAH